MIHALHGNAGLPDDLTPLLLSLGRPFNAWHLWKTLASDPQAASLEGFGRLLNETVSSSSARPHILLGYSLGARLALHALLQAPALWDAAILLAPHPGLQGEAERRARLAADLSWAARFASGSWTDVMTAWHAQPVLAGTPPPDTGKLEPWRTSMARAFDVWSTGRQADLRPQLASVTCPVLWLTGALDEKFTALAAAVPLLPRATHAVIAGAGHRMHLDQPAAAAAAVCGFLSAADC